MRLMRVTVRRKICSVLLAALSAAVLGGCQVPVSQNDVPGMQQEAEERDDNLLMIGVSQVGSESVWRTANTASIQNTFTKDKGYFLIFKNARQKQENQIKALRSFISQRVDYIVFSPLTEDGWDTVLQEAKEAGIPVIIIDRQVKVEDSSLYATWIGSDFRKEGRMAAEALEKILKQQGREDETVRIVVLQGTEGSTAAIGRTNGFDDVAQTHGNWLVMERACGEFTTAKGQEEMAKLLEKYSDIDVVVSQNDDMTFGALEAIHGAGLTAGTRGDIMVISFDGVKNALKLVKDDVISVDVECNPNHGEQVRDVIGKLEKGESVAKLNFMPEKVYTRDNVDDVLDEGSN